MAAILQTTVHILKCDFQNENHGILIQMLMKCVPNGPNNNTLELVQIMA